VYFIPYYSSLRIQYAECRMLETYVKKHARG
jgi:hypothetical protein